MANTITALNPAIWRPIVQDFLNNILIAREIANSKFESDLVDGSSINFPQMSDVYVQDYTQGTDLTIEALNSTQSTLTINQSKAVAIPIDPVQERQARAKFATVMSMQFAFRLANQIDKDLLATGVTGASTTTTGGTLSTSTIFSTFTTARAQLFRNNATDGPLFAVVDAERVALLSQTFVANGFNMADMHLQNQFVGQSNGFDVYCSNNLPSTVNFTLAVNPTAGDTFTILGVTFTFVANGTATLPGDISISAVNVDATQLIVVNAINGTGTPGASTYIELSIDDRNTLRNAVEASAAMAGPFDTPTADVSVITAAGRIGATGTFNSGSNLFGTETTSLLFGRKGAISLGLQMLPNLYIREEPKQLARNFITHTLYGTKVFSRDAKRLTAVTINA